MPEGTRTDIGPMQHQYMVMCTEAKINIIIITCLAFWLGNKDKYIHRQSRTHTAHKCSCVQTYACMYTMSYHCFTLTCPHVAPLEMVDSDCCSREEQMKATGCQET